MASALIDRDEWPADPAEAVELSARHRVHKRSSTTQLSEPQPQTARAGRGETLQAALVAVAGFGRDDFTESGPSGVDQQQRAASGRNATLWARWY